MGNLASERRRKVLGLTDNNPLLQPYVSNSGLRTKRNDKLLPAMQCSSDVARHEKPQCRHVERLPDFVSKVFKIETEADKPVRGLSYSRSRRMHPSKHMAVADREEDVSDDTTDSDGMSDFIVHDSENDLGWDTELSLDEEIKPNPRRRLVRGRRPSIPDRSPNPIETEQSIGRFPDDSIGPDAAHQRVASIPWRVSDQPTIPDTRTRTPDSTSASVSRVTHLLDSGNSPAPEAHALQIQLSNSLVTASSGSRTKANNESQTQPAVSRSKHVLTSPRKLPRMPKAPHQEGNDQFWTQDVVIDFNNEFSPIKELISTPKPKPLKNGSSLFASKETTSRLGREEKSSKKLFSLRKHQLAQSFLDELDSTIADGQISRLSASTGGVKIIWSKKLNTTAGRANWKRETIHSPVDNSDSTELSARERHHASIELAEKVIDNDERLLNVLAHEFCHLATFMLSGIKTNPHGKEFKVWARKCTETFGARGISVTTKHNYDIDYKYVWQCTNCDQEFQRHSKSIDPAKHQCGVCNSKLVQIKPVPKLSATGEKKVTNYQQFVKDHMAEVRLQNPGSPQKDIMRLLGKRYQERKVLDLDKDNLMDPKDIDNATRNLVQQLTVLDLTSP